MTVTTALQQIHTLYQGDVDEPSSSDDDYTARLRIINAAIDNWSSEGDGRWRELFTTLSDAADGDKTTTASDGTLVTPTDFRTISGYVRIDDENGNQTFYPQVDIEKEQLLSNNTQTRRFYITGNESSGFVINVKPAPTVSSRTISYEYFKQATQVTTGTDVIEMDDPYYVIYYTLSVLFENDGEGDRAIKALQQANDRLAQMKLRNLVAGSYQENSIPDRYYDLGVPSFGV